METHPTILFDGVCNFCNRMVNFVIRFDRKDRFRFAPLQSKAGEAFRETYHIPLSVDSFIYIENGKAHVYSTAALKVLIRMGFPWLLMGFFLIVPTFIRDGIYKWIGKNRYGWFGKRDSCMVPTPEIRKKFLD